MKEGLESVSPEDVKFSARLLLVEDSPISQIVAKEAFTFWGLDVDFVTNGQDAVDRVSRIRYDLVFMDCQMPVMDGYTATKKIRELEAARQIKKVPIIALTVHSSLKERMKILECGMDGYVAKPFQMEGIFSCLKEWLGDKMFPRNPSPEKEKEEFESNDSVLDEKILADLRELEAKGSPGLLKKLFQAYKDSSENQVKEMTEDLNSGAFDKIAEKSHMLKSSSHHIGAVALAGLFSKLETAVRNHSKDELPSLLEKVRQEYARVLESIENKSKS